MELWDLYDRNRNKLDKVAKRGDKLADSEYHLVVNAWIMNSKGEFLISQRVPTKPHPLMWECTGGSALKGEDSLKAAFREVKEELGIDVSKNERKFIGFSSRYYVGFPDILDVWLFKKDVPIEEVVKQDEEVNDVMWASKDKIKELYENGQFEATCFFEDIIYNGEDKQ